MINFTTTERDRKPRRGAAEPQRPLKILFLSHYFPPEVNAPATRTYEHCVRWARAGHHVSVITGQPNCPNGVVYEGYRNRLLSEHDYMDGIHVSRVWTYVAANSGIVRRTLNYLSFMFSAIFAGLLRRKPDVIIATSPQFFCGWAGIILGILRRVPVILEIRDVWPASIEAVGAMHSKPALRCLVYLEQMMYRLAPHIVTVGQGYRDHIINRVGQKHAKKIRVITNGVDLTKYPETLPDENFLARHRLRDKFVCGYVGTIGMAHGLDVVLRAAQILKQKGRRDICFCLVGEGARKARLETMARHLGVSDWVRFVGMVPKTDIPGVLASCDAILVHLRSCELFSTVIPSKIFESMAMQKPIIMGVSGEAYRIVDEAHAGIPMKPDSETDLVRIVELLADNPEMAREMSESGRKYVTTNFNRDDLAAAYLDVLQGVVEQRDPTVATKHAKPRAADRSTADNLDPSVSAVDRDSL